MTQNYQISIAVRCLLLMMLIIFGGRVTAADAYQERIRMTADKNIYVSGETIQLHILTTDTSNRPQNFSKVAYAELIGDGGPEQKIIMSLRNTAGTGTIKLPDYLPTGWYRLVAYTRAMRNVGPNAYASTTIGVINPHHTLLTGTSDEAALISNSEDSIIIHVQTDKKVYDTRETGELTISGLPADVHLLNIRISGLAPYQTSPPELKSVALAENVQLPQTDVLLPEYEEHIITGKLYKAEGNGNLPTAGINIYLSAPGKPWSLIRGKVTPEGMLTFITQRMENSKEIVTVVTSSDNERWQIDLDSPFASHTPANFPPLLVDSNHLEAILHDIAQRTLALQAKTHYAENHKDDNRLGELRQFAQSLYQPTWSYRLDDYTRFSKLEDIIIEFVSNVRFRTILGQRKLSVNTEELDGYAQGNTLVLLDDVPVFNHELLLTYNSHLIENIDVFRGKYVFGGQLFDGIVSFTTYTRDFAGFELDYSTTISNYPEIQPFKHISPEGTVVQQTHAHLPDFRHTLLWMPSVHTSGKGEQTFKFSTSDLTGSFEVEVTGVTTDGKTIRGKSGFTTTEAHRWD